MLNAAAADARLTHIHPKCAAANVIYVSALRDALLGTPREEIYRAACERAQQLSPVIHALLLAAADREPDTNGAIAGALLGAFFGSEKIPAAWRDAVLTARLDRPERYSARHADALLARLLRHEP